MAHADFFAPIDGQSITTRAQWSNAGRNFGEGVGRNADGSYGLVVTATTGRIIDVSAGQALVNGLWGDFLGHTLEVPNADASLDRWDLVCVELDATIGSETMQTKVVSGTPAATPVRPGLVYGSGDTWQIPLVYVFVPAGSANVLAEHVYDVRHLIGGSPLLASQDATSGIVTFSNIPQRFNHLRVIWQARTDTAGGNRIDMQFHDSGGANIGENSLHSYLVQLHGSGTRTDTHTAAALSNYRAGHAGGSQRSFGELLIPDYSGDEQKGFTGSGVSFGTTAGSFSNWQSGGSTNGVGSIYEVALHVIGGNFAAGTIWLYGSN